MEYLFILHSSFSFIINNSRGISICRILFFLCLFPRQQNPRISGFKMRGCNFLRESELFLGDRGILDQFYKLFVMVFLQNGFVSVDHAGFLFLCIGLPCW